MKRSKQNTSNRMENNINENVHYQRPTLYTFDTLSYIDVIKAHFITSSNVCLTNAMFRDEFGKIIVVNFLINCLALRTIKQESVHVVCMDALDYRVQCGKACP